MRDAYLCKMLYVDVISLYAWAFIDKQPNFRIRLDCSEHVMPVTFFNNEWNIRWFTLVER